MNYSKLSSSKPRLKKIAEISLYASLPPSKSGSAYPEKKVRLPDPSESEVEQIFRRWDIGKRVCRCC